MFHSTTSMSSSMTVSDPVLHSQEQVPSQYPIPAVSPTFAIETDMAPATIFSLDTDIASTTVSRPTLISWSEIPMDADLRMLDERMYSVGHTRVTLRLWRFSAGNRAMREKGSQYILELSGGGCRRKVLLGCDHASAVSLCDRLTLARLSPLHLDDVLADGDLFEV